MNLSRSPLLLGGNVTFLIALLHLALVFRPQWYRYFGTDDLVQLHEQGSPFTVLVTLGLTVMFAIWGAYAFSVAGVFGRLPALRVVLITIGVIHVLRSLLLPSEFIRLLQGAGSFRFILFSAASFSIGALYLFGSFAE